ncbi:serine/threonine-protein kinase [Polyangium mundeleinium]|uniref:Serine/threonine-protein kinase n=1 Tax=Polyangium mundeleinium TaxID=2995306 RepID=A0ABT5ELS0_9BACT|nr:serine/threonine-protein kinase [Polyangium mundeleinium]MDC0742741.1 serine/threonine-protein kinase [Polyangium mundeleinium]
MAQDVFGIAGTTQGPFTIEEAVAEGGFGVVYRALHGAFRAPVALKCLKIPTIPEDLRAGFLERFREEAEMLFRLSATISEVVRPLHYDVITLDSGLIVPFIALEWLEGRTLWSLIEQRATDGLPPLGYVEAARLLTPVARALDVAHNFPGGAQGALCVVHRDIKPANIFLAEVHGTEYVKILDFGIARARDAASVMAGEMTQADTATPLAFTPRYGAPEQWAPKRFGTTGPWTDVWGLALAFLETIAGRVVIDGDAVAIMGTVLDEKRRPTPRNEGIAVPDALEAVFRRALAVDPRERPGSAGAFWDEVEQALGLGPRLSAPAGHRSGIMRAPAIEAPQGESRRPSGSMRAVSVPPASLDVASTVLADAPSEGGGRISRFPEPPAPSARARDAAAIDVDWGASGPSAPQRRSSASMPAVRLDSPASPPSSRVSSVPKPRVSAAPREPLPREPPPREPLPSVSNEPAPDVRSMLGGPVALAGAGVIIRVLDQIAGWLWLGGERVGLGPLRLSYVAAILIGAGALLALARLLRHLTR